MSFHFLSNQELAKHTVLESIADLKKCLHQKGSSNPHEDQIESVCEEDSFSFNPSVCQSALKSPQEDFNNFRREKPYSLGKIKNESNLTPNSYEEAQEEEECEFRKPANKFSRNGIDELRKENDELKALISKIRKDSRLQIQQYEREKENCILEIKETYEHQIKEIQFNFQEEMKSKDEELEALNLIYGGGCSRRDNREELLDKEELETQVKILQEKNNKLEAQASQDKLTFNQEKESIQLECNKMREEIQQWNGLCSTFQTDRNGIESLYYSFETLNEENRRLQSERDGAHAGILDTLRQKQKDLEDLGQKYECEIADIKKEYCLKMEQQQKEYNNKMEILVKENIILAQNISSQQSQIQNSFQKSKSTLDNSPFQHSNYPQAEKENSLIEVRMQSDTQQSNKSLSTLSPLPIQKPVQHEKALKSLLNKISDFIGKREVSPERSSVDISASSSLNHHYNKKLRNLREQNNNSVSTSQVISRSRSLSTTTQNDTKTNYSSNSTKDNGRYSIDTKTSEMQPRLKAANVNSSFSEGYNSCSTCPSNNLQINKRVVSLDKRDVSPKSFYYNSEQNHLTSPFYTHSERQSVSKFEKLQKMNDVSLKNVNKVNELSTTATPTATYNQIPRQIKQKSYLQNENEEEKAPFSGRVSQQQNSLIYNNDFSQQQRVQEQRVAKQEGNDDKKYELQKIPKRSYKLNHNYLDSSPVYSMNINNRSYQETTPTLSENNNKDAYDTEKENYSYSSNSFQDPSSKFKIKGSGLQNTSDKWDKMDFLKVEDEEESGFISTIKDLHSQIKLIKK